MSKGLGKFYITKYRGVMSAAWNEAVGVTLKGNQSFTTSDPARPGARRVCLPLLEGLAAIFGRQVLASHVAPDGAIYVKVDAAAYEDTPVAEAPATNVVGYYDRPRSLVGSSLPSSSGTGSKTEISVAACALVEASELWSRDENPEARQLLEAHLEVLAALEDAGANPLGTRKVERSALPADFEDRLGDLTDRIYSWAVYMGKRPGSAPETAWGYSRVVSWPVAGDAADEVASVAAGDPHNTLADRARLEGLLRLAPSTTRAAKLAAPKTAPARAAVETFVERAVRWARRVNIPILLQGPAGTGKTQALVASPDGMPVYRTSMTAEADVATAIGDLARSAAGDWVPRLGRLSIVVRYAMLAAIVVALRRGARLAHPDADAFTSSESAREVWWALEALAANPDDAVSRAVLDERAWPYDPESWAPVLHTYVTTEAYAVGTVVSLFLDEIHDAANANPSFQTVLKLALEGERVFLTEVAGAGWAPMYCHNVAFTAAGNPDEHGQFGRALRSRFGLAVGVGYAAREQAMLWHESRFGAGTPAVPPVMLTAARSLALAGAAFEPPAPKKSTGLSSREIGAVVDFGLWTREENRAGRLAEGLETRGEAQVLQVMRHLRDEESLAPSAAFASAATLVVDRLCLLDDLGLPDHDQRESAIQKIEEIARRF
jgi:MoxR-like ATPase